MALISLFGLLACTLAGIITATNVSTLQEERLKILPVDFETPSSLSLELSHKSKLFEKAIDIPAVGLCGDQQSDCAAHGHKVAENHLPGLDFLGINAGVSSRNSAAHLTLPAIQPYIHLPAYSAAPTTLRTVLPILHLCAQTTLSNAHTRSAAGVALLVFSVPRQFAWSTNTKPRRSTLRIRLRRLQVCHQRLHRPFQASLQGQLRLL